MGDEAALNLFGIGVQSAGHNIDSLDQCNFHAAGDMVSTNPLLAALASNGGPTETLALSPGSSAIDAGDAGCPATDQRGVTRPQGAACDIGAFELQIPPSVGGGPAPVVAHPACVVPNLKGHKLKADRKRLKKAGCKLGKVKGHKSKSAKVKKQGVKPGTVLPLGSEVNVEAGGLSRTSTKPKVTGSNPVWRALRLWAELAGLDRDFGARCRETRLAKRDR